MTFGRRAIKTDRARAPSLQTADPDMPAFTLIDFSREVLDEICSHLVPVRDPLGTQYYPRSLAHKWRRPEPTRRHLCNLALTCKVLRAVATPWLYMDLTYPAVPLKALTSLLSGKDSSSDNAPAQLQLVRRVQIGHFFSPLTYEELALLRTMRNLNHIVCGTTLHDQPEFIDALMDALTQRSGIQSLQIHGGGMTSHAKVISLLKRITQRIQLSAISLVDLTLGPDVLGSFSELDKMGTLKSISIDGSANATAFLASIPATLAVLTHLTLDNCEVEPDTFADLALPQIAVPASFDATSSRRASQSRAFLLASFSALFRLGRSCPLSRLPTAGRRVLRCQQSRQFPSADQ